MEGVKWTVDPSVSDELPQPQEVSRAMLAAPDFDTEKFLTQISDYRSLRDVQEVIGYWETRLHAELSNTVNANFNDFVQSAASVSNGKELLSSVHADMERFSSKAAREHQQLANSAEQIAKELKTHKYLCMREAEARKILHMLDLLAELETAVPEAEVENTDMLLSLARSYVAMASIASEMRHVKVVQVKSVTVASIQGEIIALLQQAVLAAQPDTKLELIEALEWVKDTK